MRCFFDVSQQPLCRFALLLQSLVVGTWGLSELNENAKRAVLPGPKIFHYLSSSDSLPDASDSALQLRSFWKLLHEEIGAPLHWDDKHPRYNFGIFDRDANNISSSDEFFSAVAHFRNPLSQVQAESIFYQLDTNHDGQMEILEFENAMHLHEASSRNGDVVDSEAVVTPLQYTDRLRTAKGSVGLELRIGQLEVSLLSDAVRADVERVTVLSIADVADIATDWIKSLKGAKGSMTLEIQRSGQGSGGPGGSGSGDVVHLKASVKTRPHVAAADLLTAVNSNKERLASDLSQVPSLKLLHGRALSPDDLQWSSFELPVVAFIAADDSGDGMLDRLEFARVTKDFGVPLSGAQAQYVFGGLDANYDGKLSLPEYSGEATDGNFVPQPFLGRHIAMEDFKARMQTAYASAQEAFEDMQDEPADVEEFFQVTQQFRPPLTREQAEFAFQGFDADHDGLLVNAEFLEVLRFGSFFPSMHEIRAMMTQTTARTWFPGFEAIPDSYKESRGLAWAAAWLLLIGFLSRSLALMLRVPPAIFVAVSAAVWARCTWPIQELVAASEPLQDGSEEVVAFLLFFSTGLSLSIPDLRLHLLALATVPAAVESVAITVYAMAALQLSFAQSLLLSLTVVGAGEGSVTAKSFAMCTSKPENRSSLTPRRATQAAPLEACLVLTAWVCSSCVFDWASSESNVALAIWDFFVLSLRFLGSLLLGTLAGLAASGLLRLRVKASARGRAWFTFSPEESATLALSMASLVHALAASSLGGWMKEGHWYSLQPELVTLTFGISMSHSMSSQDLQAVDGAVAGLWSMGQFVLFTFYGFELYAYGMGGAMKVVPMLALGLVCRFLGYFVTMASSKPSVCPCDDCHEADRASLCQDASFHFLVSLQRTSLQAFCGSETNLKVILSKSLASGNAARSLTAVAARLYFFLLSSVGALLFELLAPSLLQEVEGCERCDDSWKDEERLWQEGWTARQRALCGMRAASKREGFRLCLLGNDGLVIDSEQCQAASLNLVLERLAKTYMVSPLILSAIDVEGSGTLEDDRLNDDGNENEEEKTPGKPRSGRSSIGARRHNSARQMPAYCSCDDHDVVGQLNEYDRNEGPGLVDRRATAGSSSSSSREEERVTRDAERAKGDDSRLRWRTITRRVVQDMLLTPRAQLDGDADLTGVDYEGAGVGKV